MVLEHRVVCSEVFEGGRLVDAKMWEVRVRVWGGEEVWVGR